MVPTKPIAVFTTVGSEDEAERIARALVERKLAACVQISRIESFYELPAIYACAIDRIFAPYGEWIATNSAATS